MINGVGGGAAGPSMFTPPGGQLGKDEFLQLLVAQMRNQDPMNPMKSDEFAVQLAQFANVEQLIMVNEQLTLQAAYSEALAEAMNSSAAMGALGHDVLAIGDQIQVADGEARATVDVGGGGGTARVLVYDSNNQVVAELDLGHVDGGRQTLELDLGRLDDGVYRYEVSVKNSEGEAVSTTSYVRGTVSGVKYGMDGHVLLIGQIAVPLNAVIEVSAN